MTWVRVQRDSVLPLRRPIACSPLPAHYLYDQASREVVPVSPVARQLDDTIAAETLLLTQINRGNRQALLLAHLLRAAGRVWLLLPPLSAAELPGGAR